MGRLFAMSHPLPSPQEQTVSGSVLMTETSGHHWAGPTAMLAALLGALSATLLPALPSSLLLTGIMSLAGLALFSSRMRLPAIALLAFCWLCLQAGWGMDARLPSELEGADLTIDGRVDGLVWPEARRQRFDFIVGHGEGEASVLDGRRVRLSWYEHEAPLPAGSDWRFVVRLQRPHGGRNPDGFDFERHALQRGLVATGYVRSAMAMAGSSHGKGIDALRDRLATMLEQRTGQRASRFLRGIGIADTRGLDDGDWEALRATGTSHLLAISGLHLGLLAGLAALLVRLAYRLIPRLGLRLPLPQAAALVALLAASGYAALAGFGLPTRRALLMLGCVLLARLLRRASGIAQGLSLALLVILLFDPLAILGAGFWLSFAGVAWLLWTLPSVGSANLDGSHGRAKRWLREAVLAQCVLSLGLLPLSLAFFGQASLLSLPLNLVAVPVLGFVVLPLTMIGIGLLLLGLPASGVLQAAGAAMEGLWWLLSRAADLPVVQLQLPTPSILALLLAGLAVVWMLMPRGMPGKPLAALLLLPMLLPRGNDPAAGQLDVQVLDVGQGLAVVLRTRNHALLYDAGPASPGSLDRGQAVVVPALRELGVHRLDRMIISHGDNDHAGGAAAVIRAMASIDVLAGEPAKLPDSSHCEAGTRWQWDGVDFQLLHPPPHFPELGNQSSCVLLVEVGGRRLLLPGDVDALIESRLLREYPELKHVDVLLVPHHGSSGSSSPAFVEALHPRLALVSDGYRNRFGHPRADVVQRYVDAGSQLHDTAGGGALSLRLGTGNDLPEVLAEREQHRHFWAEAAYRPGTTPLNQRPPESR